MTAEQEQGSQAGSGTGWLLPGQAAHWSSRGALIPKQCFVCCGCGSFHLFPGILVPNQGLRQLRASLCLNQGNYLIETLGRRWERREEVQGRGRRNKSQGSINRVSPP